ncbi:UDP-N-acetylmuramoyl-L-alanine--D-glutamate ligase, partial [bacterium]|nr:UDP-N-acetylmuramoyl-L-alanine--D-glutamate ligase [bacterium]
YDLLKDFDMIVISPGVDPTKSPILELKQENKPVFGDIELIYHLTDKPFICITGTNGKTTTTRLIANILENDGRKIVIGGNMPGSSLASKWDQIKEAEAIVCEISSFQLEGIDEFRPRIACYLNISPDHIDRYPDFETYFIAKNRIYKNMNEEDCLIMNFENMLLRGLESEINAKLYYFSSKREVVRGTFLYKDKLIFRNDDKEEKLLAKDAVSLPGIHNLENVLASITASWLYGAKKLSIEKTMKEFRLNDHTLEFVALIEGVKFINDSKGTNVDSVISALNSFEEPIILLAGGKDKGCDYKKLSRHLKKKVKRLILFGEARDIISSAVDMNSKIEKVQKMSEGVRLAFKLSSSGDLVLLSPACSSFDEFRNYAHRGEEFKKTVLSLKRERKS